MLINIFGKRFDRTSMIEISIKEQRRKKEEFCCYVIRNGINQSVEKHSEKVLIIKSKNLEIGDI